MTEITHQTARALIQAAVDRPLEPADTSSLEAHIATCQDCSRYAAQVTNLEKTLRQSMHAKWDGYHPALDLQAIQNPTPLRLLWNNMFGQSQVFGKATMIAALLVGYIVIANIVGARFPISNNETPTALPTPNESTPYLATSPTPSTQLAATNFSCQTMLYVVREHDTLESIAVRHGIPKEAILEYNPGNQNLVANTVFTGMELVLPLCKSTPAHTASVTGDSLTITPLYGTILPETAE